MAKKQEKPVEDSKITTPLSSDYQEHGLKYSSPKQKPSKKGK